MPSVLTLAYATANPNVHKCTNIQFLKNLVRTLTTRHAFIKLKIITQKISRLTCI